MKLVIIGGVAGGASAAARARRLNEDAQITVFERGEHISFANCGLPYHIGQTITDRAKLLIQTPQAMKARFNIDVHTRCEIISIDRQARQVLVRDLANGREYRQDYDKLILSPGAEPIRPPIPGINSPNVFTLRSMADMDAIKAVVDKDSGARAVIIGGGYIGLEMAEALRNRKMAVTLVELDKQVFGPIDPEMAWPVAAQVRSHGVDLWLGNAVAAIEQSKDGLRVKLGSGETVDCSLVLVSIGVRPENRLAKDAGLAVGSRGGIIVDEYMRTSDPDIYAVGDAVEVQDYVGNFATMIPLAGPANRQGRIAADNIMGQVSTYKKTQGTGICKIFDLTVAMTGLSEKALKRLAVPYEKVYVHPASHATYYPGASQMSLKLLFDPASGKILGAQAVGSEGVDKRIDVLSVAMRAGMTVRDLQDMELSYAPPYGSAKDPINYAGFVASNIMDGNVAICHWDHMLNPRQDQVLVDIRTPAETQAGTIGSAINIPLDELRSRISELPRDKELLVFCQVGLRGYIACRILSQIGYKCRNLTGGYKTFRVASAIDSPATAPGNKIELKDDAGGAVTQSKENKDMPNVVKQIDACGLQCPGPIMELKTELDKLEQGQALTISTRDPGFAADIGAWCHSTGNELAGLLSENGMFKATVVKMPQKSTAAPETSRKQKTIVVFSNDLDRALASFIIANGAAAMGSQVTMFFTFWGLNVLRKSDPAPVSKNLIERLFGMMMPRGASKLTLSKMHMGGLGTAMMKGIMKTKSVASLEELMAKAQASGVRLIACSMSMDIMGIKKDELIDGVELGGVAMYLDHAEAGSVNLFI